MRDANDRHANIEVAYLLQPMEEYDGVVILATNLRKNHAGVALKAGKQYDASSLIFSDGWWEKATPVDWPPETKQEYLLAVWDDLLRGADATWATDAARAADAS